MSENRISKINVGGTVYNISGSGGSGIAVGTEAEIGDMIENGDLGKGDAFLITDDTPGGTDNSLTALQVRYGEDSNVKAELDEINTALSHRLIGTITSDGVKTFSQILDSLYTISNVSSLSDEDLHRLQLDMTGHGVMRITSIGETSVTLGRTVIGSTNLQTEQTVIRASGSSYKSYDGSTITNLSSSVDSEGRVYKLYLR